jgi:hypothetical protein
MVNINFVNPIKGESEMRTSHKLTQLLLSLAALIVLTTMAMAQQQPVGPGVPTDSVDVNDQKAGSILIYNYYTSSATNPNATNTRINITNTNPSFGVAVHLFFVADSCSVADAFICLTKNQTASFLMSDIDPNINGYIIAVATDGLGCPVNFNWLIGDEYVKRASGHAASLAAESVQAHFGVNLDSLPGCTAATIAVLLVFDGAVYDFLPRVVAVASIPSRADGNDTLLILNGISGGSLLTSVSGGGSLFGILFDDAENPFSFTTSVGCQLAASLGATATFPRTTPPFNTVIPAGRTGWLKLWTTGGGALLGAVINFNPSAATSAGAFNGGHNLHKLTRADRISVAMPVFMPVC